MDERIPQVYPYPVPTARPVAWITRLLVSTTVAVFLLQLFYEHYTGDDVLGEALAFSPDAWSQGHYWTVLTYAWAHAVAPFGDTWFDGLFWLHIVSNMIPLICLGPALEEMLGHGRFLGLYLGGAIAAALVWMISTSLAGAGGPDAGLPSDPANLPEIVGASGAVFAIIAAIGTAAPRLPVTVLFFFFLPVKMTLRVLALVICGLEALQAIFHWLPEVSHSAHLGGATFGFLYVLLQRQHVHPASDFP